MRRCIWIKRILLLAVFAALIVLWQPMTFKLFGTISWYLLVAIVCIRPLADIFPQRRWLRLLVALRKELGILCATYGIAHGVGFFLARDISISGLASASTRSLMSTMGSGLWAVVIALPLLLTSNMYAMRFLSKYWKPLQRLTYLFFIITALHVALAQHGAYIEKGITVGARLLLWILAYTKTTFTEHKKIIIGSLCMIGIAIIGGSYYASQNKPARPHMRPDTSTQSGNIQTAEELFKNI